MSNKLVVCKTCGHEIAKNAKTCPNCGAKIKKPIFKKWWFWFLIAMFIAIGAGANGGTVEPVDSNGNTSSGDDKKANASVNRVVSVFEGDCGISASAEIGNNMINFPELKITITNKTEKEISAIKFYAVPYDVYGDEIKGWTTQSNLYTDTSIPAGKTTSISYQLIEQSVKTVKLYVYSVFFEDGTEWGNKDALPSKIIKEAPTIEVTVNS